MLQLGSDESHCEISLDSCKLAVVLQRVVRFSRPSKICFASYLPDLLCKEKATSQKLVLPCLRAVSRSQNLWRLFPLLFHNGQRTASRRGTTRA